MRQFILMGIALLAPTLAIAQQDGALPDAPASAVVGNAATDDQLTSAPQPVSPIPAPLPVEPSRVLTPWSATYDRGTTPWPASIAWANQPPTEFASAGVRVDLDALLGRMSRPSGDSSEAAGPEGMPEPMGGTYHWKGLLWESFAFFGVENMQRLPSDPYYRLLLADKPFWHDYFASLKQWNWRRWNDGDDFLVAYIAHPLQGAVTGYIEVQNSTSQRLLEINDGKAYWKSRLGPAMLWNAAFSFDQKLGPLGEAAFGSEGGYTYVIGCPYPCKAYYADPSHFKVTNNTGWVKMVSTPVVGTLWMVMEDAIDHFISDRVQGDDIHRTFPKILRGSLNPARTMANALRWRTPWYRDWQRDTEDQFLTPRPHFLPGDDEVILALPKLDFFPHFDGISLPVNTATCSHCRRMTTGYGFGFAQRIATYADLDYDISFQPNASPLPSDRAGGNIVTGTFGLRSGYTSKYYSLKAYLRPGFLSYDRAYEFSQYSKSIVPPIGRITHFTTALGIEGDYYLTRQLAIRGAVGNQPVRYREARPGKPEPVHYPTGTYPYLSWLSVNNFLTNENWAYQAGAVLRF